MFRIEEAVLDEGKKEYLAKYGSEPDAQRTVDVFWTLRHRVKAPENDIDWWIKKPFADLKRFVDGFDTRKRSERRSDEHARKAEENGAVLLGRKGGYEIWYVPSYEAAVELGRFYKNASAEWCISTDNDEYFNRNYSDYEFLFLIYDDPDECPEEGFGKLAVQFRLASGRVLTNFVRVWDIEDNDVTEAARYAGSAAQAAVDYALSLVPKLPYDRDGYMDA